MVREGKVELLIRFVFFQAEDGIRDIGVTGVQTCALPILFAEGVLVSDPKPKDEEIEARGAEGDAGESPLDRRPPKDLPEELVMGRLGRLDTRRALAELCKSVPGLDEVLLDRKSVA